MSTNQRDVLTGNKTHCPQGHKYTPDNTYLLKNGPFRMRRICRQCAARRGKAYRSRKESKDKKAATNRKFEQRAKRGRAGSGRRRRYVEARRQAEMLRKSWHHIGCVLFESAALSRIYSSPNLWVRVNKKRGVEYSLDKTTDDLPVNMHSSVPAPNADPLQVVLEKERWQEFARVTGGLTLERWERLPETDRDWIRTKLAEAGLTPRGVIRPPSNEWKSKLSRDRRHAAERQQNRKAGKNWVKEQDAEVTTSHGLRLSRGHRLVTRQKALGVG